MRTDAQPPTGGIYRPRNPRASPLYQCLRRHGDELDAAGLIHRPVEGGKTIILSRFIPIIRTFAPFVAGVGCMQPRRFAAYSFAGGFLWVTAFIWSGYLFGNVPLVKNNFGVVTIGIIALSVVPVFWGLLKPSQTDRPSVP